MTVWPTKHTWAFLGILNHCVTYCCCELGYMRLWFVHTKKKERKHSWDTCTACATDYCWPTRRKNSSASGDPFLSFLGLPTIHHWIKALHPWVGHLRPTNTHYQEHKMQRMISPFGKLVSGFVLASHTCPFILPLEESQRIWIRELLCPLRPGPQH